MRIWYEYAINMMDFSYDGIITKQRYDTNISSKHTIHNIYIYTIYIFQRQLDPFGLLFNRHPQFDPMAPLVATATRPERVGVTGVTASLSSLLSSLLSLLSLSVASASVSEKRSGQGVYGSKTKTKIWSGNDHQESNINHKSSSRCINDHRQSSTINHPSLIVYANHFW